jgi:hypothetical protein
MKKIIALVLALSLLATMVVAEPVVFAFGIIQTTDLISETGLDDPLFADVAAPRLAAFEADQVEGDGGFAGVALGVLGGAIGVAINCYRYGAIGSNYSVAVADRGWRTGFMIGFAIGLIF